MEAKPCHEALRLVRADPLPRLGVEEDHGAVVVADRQHASVGTERKREDVAALAVQYAERRGAAQERREETGAGRNRVVEGDAGVGEADRPVEAVLGDGLGRQPLSVGDGGRVAGALALGDRDHPGDHRGGEQHADPGEQRPQPADGAALALGLALAGSPALLEERSLELVQLGVVLGGPVERRGQASAAVELGGVALGFSPVTGGADQVVVKTAALGVGFEPAAKARPLAKQRLVGDLHRTLVDGKQAALGEHSQGLGGVEVAFELELVEGDAAADERLRRLVIAGEPQQHRPRPAPLGLAEPLVGALGQARDRALDAAGCARSLGSASVRPSRRCQSSSRAAESSGRPPGSPAMSPISAATSRGSTRSPALRAGSSIARRSSSRRIGPTRTWLALIRVESSACSAQRP